MQPLALGIDLGTSGCRAVAIDTEGKVRARADVELPPPRRAGRRCEQEPGLWWDAVLKVLAEVSTQVPPASIRTLAIDGTSGTLLLTDQAGRPLGPALMYDDARSAREAAIVAAAAPSDCGACGPTAALAKLLHLQAQPSLRDARHALHQADWIMGCLTGRFGISDENNCLKLGYDAIHRRWPPWFSGLGVREALLPAVVSSGAVVGPLKNAAVRTLGFSTEMQIVAGTTDGVAAFLATGAQTLGDAVTSLGSTLVIKVLAAEPVFSPQYGIYSHRLGDLWLAGGSSNSGGAVLLRYFTIAELDAMTPRLAPEHATGLDYYPLVSPGERFPYNDPALMPRLTPRPDDDVIFFQAMLEGMARIEALAYRRLAELGAPWPRRVLTVGGGARNPSWTGIRRRLLDIPFDTPRCDQACYGAALIARRASVT